MHCSESKKIAAQAVEYTAGAKAVRSKVKAHAAQMLADQQEDQRSYKRNMDLSSQGALLQVYRILNLFF